MQLLPRLLTTLAFAAHGLLGCCAHFACQHGLAPAAIAAEASHHDCQSGPCHDSREPAGDGEQPGDHCQHSTCSFTKAETLDFDPGGIHACLPVAWGMVAAAGSLPPSPASSCFQPLWTTELYVWHCALLI